MSDVQLIQGRLRPVEDKLMGAADLPAAPLLKNLTEDQLKVLNIYKVHEELDYDPRTHVATDVHTVYEPALDKVIKTATFTKKKVADLRLELLRKDPEGNYTGVIWDITERHRKASIKVDLRDTEYLVCIHDHSRMRYEEALVCLDQDTYPTDQLSGEILDVYPVLVRNITDPENAINEELQLTSDELMVIRYQVDAFYANMQEAFDAAEAAIPSTSFNDLWSLADAYEGTLPINGDRYLQLILTAGDAGV